MMIMIIITVIKITTINIYIYYKYIYMHIHWEDKLKLALVELPTVNICGFFFFFCTPFPRRILAWSFVVPRSHFHSPKALKSYRFKSG